VNGRDPRERGDAADQILAKVTKSAAGPSLAISVSFEAELPPAAGGSSIIVPQNYPVPTNSRVAFKFGVTQPAHVYLFQVDVKKEVSVLFPDDRMATRNPLQANGSARVPENGLHFRVDENGLGTETVYIVASGHALPHVERSLRRFQSGEVKSI